MTDRLFRRFLIGVTACLVASAPPLFAANVCLLQEAPFLAKSQPVYEDVSVRRVGAEHLRDRC